MAFIKKKSVDYAPPEGSKSGLRIHIGEDGITITDTYGYTDDYGNHPVITIPYDDLPYVAEVLEDIYLGDD
jgi:hypothetical protein